MSAVRRPRLERGGRRCESCRPDHFESLPGFSGRLSNSSVAQQQSTRPITGDRGASPRGRTTQFSTMDGFVADRRTFRRFISAPKRRYAAARPWWSHSSEFSVFKTGNRRLDPVIADSDGVLLNTENLGSGSQGVRDLYVSLRRRRLVVRIHVGAPFSKVPECKEASDRPFKPGLAGASPAGDTSFDSFQFSVSSFQHDGVGTAGDLVRPAVLGSEN